MRAKGSADRPLLPRPAEVIAMPTSHRAPVTVARLERFRPTHGWANRLLWVDLSDRTIRAEPLDPYVPGYIGGRGLAARLAWDLCPEPVDPFAPANPLMFLPGALTGSRSPYSGRTAVCSFSPQAYPHPWFTRSNMGHHWGAELKRAGYDGLIVTGASDSPVQLIIRDDEVTIAPADDLWGLDAYDAQEAARHAFGADLRTVTIGPAGERLSRIATIHTATSSAAGQGGFGAVMGAKRLKAISVAGSGTVSIAHEEAFQTLVRLVGEGIRTYRRPPNTAAMTERLQQVCPGGRVRPYACTAACPTPCNAHYSNVRGVAMPDRVWEGHWTCVGSLFRGVPERGGVYDWALGEAAGLEMNVLSNRYGLNQWEIIIGMVPWLERCGWAGLLSEWDGRPIDWRSPHFWAEFLHALAYREGLGDALAEGGVRAAQALGLGPGLIGRSYTAWGYAGHWDGHGSLANYLVFPYWVVSALQWMSDTRDPYSSSHGYVQNVMRWSPLGAMRNPVNKGPAVTWDEMRGIGQKVYGSPDAVDPHSGYAHKAFPAYYHDLRSVMKDALPTDDQVFPLIYSVTSEDRLFRIGDIEGPAVDSRLFRLGTGVDWDEAAFARAAERIYTLERALNVRHWGRDRGMDEQALSGFDYEENWQSQELDAKHTLDREAFRPVADEYYRHLGWDVASGRPTEERLVALGLGGVHAPMLAGAAAAEERRLAGEAADGAAPAAP